MSHPGSYNGRAACSGKLGCPRTRAQVAGSTASLVRSPSGLLLLGACGHSLCRDISCSKVRTRHASVAESQLSTTCICTAEYTLNIDIGVGQMQPVTQSYSLRSRRPLLRLRVPQASMAPTPITTASRDRLQLFLVPLESGPFLFPSHPSVSNPSQGASCGSHLEMMGESLWIPNGPQSSRANPLCPCLPQTFAESGKVSGPPYLPAFISE